MLETKDAVEIRPVVVVIRWVAALPAGVAVGYLAYLLMVVARALGLMGEYGPEDSFFGALEDGWFALIANGMMGWAAVAAMSYVAPSRKEITAIVGCGLCIFFAGFCAFASLLLHSYFPIACSVAMIVGAAVAAVAVYNHELKV